MDEVRFINDDHFVVLMRRPIREVDGYATMVMFDEDLNVIKKILPRANDENLVLLTHPNGVLGKGDGDLTFWEPYLDTLYTINSEGEATPTHVIGFSKDGPSREYAKTATYGRDPELEPKNNLYGVKILGGYLHLGGVSNNERFTALYNIRNGEFFQLSENDNPYLLVPESIIS
jgi:hypothetical protein